MRFVSLLHTSDHNTAEESTDLWPSFSSSDAVSKPGSTCAKTGEEQSRFHNGIGEYDRWIGGNVYNIQLRGWALRTVVGVYMKGIREYRKRIRVLWTGWAFWGSLTLLDGRKRSRGRDMILVFGEGQVGGSVGWVSCLNT